MGQRLVIEIEKDNNLIAAIYYHWSAYTSCSMEKLHNIVKYLKTVNLKDDFIPGLIHHIEKQGGGIDGGEDSDEYKYISEKYPDEKFEAEPSRNEGLVCISEKGIAELQGWSEGTARIIINSEAPISEQRVNNFVYSSIYGSYDEANEDYKEWAEEELKEDEIPESKIDPENMTWDELSTMVDFTNDACEPPYMIKYDGLYYSMLE